MPLNHTAVDIFYSTNFTSLKNISKIFRLDMYPETRTHSTIVPVPKRIPTASIYKMPLSHIIYPKSLLKHLNHQHTDIYCIL